LYSSPKGDQIKEDEMGGTCSTHGSYGNFIRSFNIKKKNRTEKNRMEGKGRSHLGDLVVDVKIIFKFIIKKCGVRVWKGFNLFRTGSNDGLFEQGSEALGSIKGAKFRNYSVSKSGSK
jgi:hypothetical protein